MGNQEYLLEMRNITKTFPGVRALDDVSFNLKPGEVHVLLGENGAGKSTLMKVLAGAYTPDSGELFIEGRRVEHFSPRHAQSLGVGIIYQEFNLVPYLNVAHNIYIDHMPRTLGGLALDHARMHRDAENLLRSLDMRVNTRALANDISVAQQQMVEVAKALTHDLKILIMDEPTASLCDREIEQLFRTIRELTDRGIGIVYISHRLQEIPRIGDRITVLRDGRYVGTSDASDMTTDRMVEMMVGREIQDLYGRTYNPKGKTALRVKGLSSRAAGLSDVSLTLNCGEIVGLSGLVGSGRTELARAIFHVDPHDSGEIELLGEPLEHADPRAVIHKGLALLPEDRKRQGLALILTLAENVVIASLSRLFPKGLVLSRREQKSVVRYVQDLRIATPGIRQFVRNLSGGNQQKVVLAKWLCTEAQVFIFDEPTRGIDVGAKQEIYAFMDDLAKKGKAVLMISSELPEIIGLCDRVYVMREGKIVAELDRTEATQETIIAYAMGGSCGDGEGAA